MKTTSETIGCDLGDKQSELFILLPSGEVQRPPAVRTTKKGFRTFFARPPAHVIIEVGTHSRWVSTVLKELGHRVTVANPRRVQLISGSYAKSDTKDAELLARMGRADEQLLSPVEHRGAEAQADLAVPKARDVLVQVRTKLVNHVRGMVKSFGERVPDCTAASFQKKAGAHIPEVLMPALGPVLEALKGVDDQIKVHDRVLDRLAKNRSRRGWAF